MRNNYSLYLILAVLIFLNVSLVIKASNLKKEVSQAEVYIKQATLKFEEMYKSLKFYSINSNELFELPLFDDNGEKYYFNFYFTPNEKTIIYLPSELCMECNDEIFGEIKGITEDMYTTGKTGNEIFIIVDINRYREFKYYFDNNHFKGTVLSYAKEDEKLSSLGINSPLIFRLDSTYRIRNLQVPSMILDPISMF